MTATTLRRGEKRQLSARLARLHNNHSYGLVLGLVGVSFLFAATAPDSPWANSVLLAIEVVTLVTALWTSGVARAGSRVSIGLLALASAVAAANLIWGGTTLAAASGGLAALLTIATAVAIAVGVADQPAVNARSVIGAISIYVSLGMLFLFIFGAISVLGSSPFFAQGTDGTRAVRLYFSYVTLATLGYGDYTPSGNVGHTFAVLEALIGQIYLVTVVAVLVSRLARPRS